MDRVELADFLRRRREALQPEDVGLPRGPRRRTAGLRREEVAALSDMSVDYYGRLEQSRGPQPSPQMLGAIARGLRLTLAERDHLFHLAGQNAPARAGGGDHVSPGTMRVLDRLADTPAQVMTALGETLVQTAAARALFGDETRHQGLMRSVVYRWFVDPAAREVYPHAEHPEVGRAFVADLRAAHAAQGPRSRAAALVDALLARSTEFAALWQEHEVRSTSWREKRLWHPDLGELELQCQILHDPDQGQVLLVLTATPGTASHDKLQLLAALGPRGAVVVD
ncbi:MULTISPECIES: helix-turn-helix transcriptional regulator [Cellulomonas]|uniref:Transcriptional regulator with XRE-family HTH domain n=1 Tax=Cellulomonas iranensis TaxID=76862 RepID=A0ABU0GLJ8_9CELL|nr:MULTISPECIES: helix-turn-helix transcriptional regulator [Cellulomonas]MDQ0425601.1 transcriptional regulator with XRE-family HTH domain [Cellulomonas iranensis]TFH72111.1 XRE family transcriptional regulator [Cellulomonas sp. HD19AZ1]